MDRDLGDATAGVERDEEEDGSFESAGAGRFGIGRFVAEAELRRDVPGGTTAATGSAAGDLIAA